MLLIRLACAVYGSLLTLLLLVPEPAKLLGLENSPGSGGRGTHFLLFFALTILVGASRWPLRRSVLALGLVVYAFLTEGLQTFFPPRQVELLDLVENLLGLLSGAVVWQGLRYARARSQPVESSVKSLTAPGPDSSAENS